MKNFDKFIESVNYSDSYNQAYHYLKNKYGYRVQGPTDKWYKEHRFTSMKKYRDALKDIPDTEQNIILNTVPDDAIDDKEIQLLMNQFYLGISAKKELHDKLKSLGII